MSSDTGLFTSAQREYIKNPQSKSGSTERDLKRRIRDRTYRGLRFDAPVLFERLSVEERRKIFRGWEKEFHDTELEPSTSELLLSVFELPEESPEGSKEAQRAERELLRDGIEKLIAFLYLGIEEGNLGDFGDILESSLSKAARESDRSLDEFEFVSGMSGARALTPTAIAERVREGDSGLHLKEVHLAYAKGALTTEEVESYLESLNLGHLLSEGFFSDSATEE